MPLLSDPRQGPWLRGYPRAHCFVGRSQPTPRRVRGRHSVFCLLTPWTPRIPPGYQGRSPWLVSPFVESIARGPEHSCKYTGGADGRQRRVSALSALVPGVRQTVKRLCTVRWLGLSPG